MQEYTKYGNIDTKRLELTAARPLKRKKFVVIGDHGCGKTSLLMVFNRDIFPEPDVFTMETGWRALIFDGKVPSSCTVCVCWAGVMMQITRIEQWQDVFSLPNKTKFALLLCHLTDAKGEQYLILIIPGGKIRR